MEEILTHLKHINNENDEDKITLILNPPRGSNPYYMQHYEEMLRFYHDYASKV